MNFIFYFGNNKAFFETDSLAEAFVFVAKLASGFDFSSCFLCVSGTSFGLRLDDNGDIEFFNVVSVDQLEDDDFSDDDRRKAVVAVPEDYVDALDFLRCKYGTYYADKVAEEIILRGFQAFGNEYWED